MITDKILRFIRINQPKCEINQIVSKGYHKSFGNYFIIYTGNDFVMLQNIASTEFEFYRINDTYDLHNFTFDDGGEPKHLPNGELCLQ